MASGAAPDVLGLLNYLLIVPDGVENLGILLLRRIVILGVFFKVKSSVLPAAIYGKLFH